MHDDLQTLFGKELKRLNKAGWEMFTFYRITYIDSSFDIEGGESIVEITVERTKQPTSELPSTDQYQITGLFFDPSSNLAKPSGGKRNARGQATPIVETVLVIVIWRNISDTLSKW